jgi:hypothetical protein
MRGESEAISEPRKNFTKKSWLCRAGIRITSREAAKDTKTEKIEKILPSSLAPWSE